MKKRHAALDALDIVLYLILGAIISWPLWVPWLGALIDSPNYD